MKKLMIRAIPLINVILWSLLSFYNYIGIMEQMGEDILKVFIWSIIIVSVYLIVIYSVTLYLKKRLLTYEYSKYNLKYIQTQNSSKQLFQLAVIIVYLYGLCYFNYIFIGVMPIFIFFSSSLMDMGRCYIIKNEKLHMIEDITKEYVIEYFIKDKRSLILREVSLPNHKTEEVVYQMEEEEIEFLSDFFHRKDCDIKKEIEPVESVG